MPNDWSLKIWPSMAWRAGGRSLSCRFCVSQGIVLGWGGTGNWLPLLDYFSCPKSKEKDVNEPLITQIKFVNLLKDLHTYTPLSILQQTPHVTENALVNGSKIHLMNILETCLLKNKIALRFVYNSISSINGCCTYC